MTKKSIGVGVISLGWMGRLHTRAYKALAEHFADVDVDIRLVSCCDPAEPARDTATNVLGFESTTDDYRETINHPDVDVVSICSPNFLHHEIAMAAIEADKPFWIEKPMGISAEQSRDIAQGAAQKNLISSVGFNYRHAPAIQYARSLITDGQLGRITNARVWLIADYASDPNGPLTWRYDPNLAGAGVILDLMGHGEDLLQYMLRDRIARVSAQSRTFIGERPIPLTAGVGHTGWEVSSQTGPVGNEDHVAILASTENGVVATLESSRVSVGPRAEYVIEIYGTEGSVRWNFETMNHLEVCIGRNKGPLQGYCRVMASPDFPDFVRFQPSAGTSMGFDDLKIIEAAKFIKGVLDGTQYGPSAADGWAAAEVDDAVVASAADGQWHDVTPVTHGITFTK